MDRCQFNIESFKLTCFKNSFQRRFGQYWSPHHILIAEFKFLYLLSFGRCTSRLASMLLHVILVALCLSNVKYLNKSKLIVCADQVPVVRKMESAVRFIQQMAQLVSLILIHLIAIYPLDSAILRLNNLSQLQG